MTIEQLKEVLSAWENLGIAKAMDIFYKYNEEDGTEKQKRERTQY